MVDDDASILKSCEMYFSRKGYSFIALSDPRAFLKVFKTKRPDIILMDIILGEFRGENLIKAFRKIGLNTPIFVISSHIDRDLIVSLKDSDIAGYITKPVDLSDLESRIRTTLEECAGTSDKKEATNRDAKKTWPPISALILTENNTIVLNPELLLPISIMEKYNIRVFARADFQEAIHVLKNPDKNIKILLIDAAKEAKIKGMLRLIKIIESNMKMPVFFFSDTFSQTFKNALITIGFVNVFSRSSVKTKEIALKFDDVLSGGGAAAKGASTRIQNIMKAIESIKSLPPMPDIYLKIEKISHNPNATSKDYADILELDPAITARLLRMSNSAFYSFKRKIKTVKDTVTLMGTREILSLVRLACITSNLKTNPDVEAAVRKVWEHSAACAITARLLYEKTALCTTRDLIEEIFICGIIHDIGQVVLWNNFSEIYMSFMLNPGVGEYPTVAEEEKFMGASHADVGRAIAEHWKLPEILHDAVAYHHKPMHRPDSETVMIVHFADVLANMILDRIPEDRSPDFSPELLIKTGWTVDMFRDFAATHGQAIKDSVTEVTKMITG